MERHRTFFSNRWKSGLVFALLVSTLVGAQTSWGQITLLGWETAGASGNEASLAASTVAANVAASSLTRGAGLTATSLANSFSASGWNETSLANAITANNYFQITVTASTGHEVNLASLAFNLRRSGTGPNAFQWRYSLDGSSFTTIGSAISYTGTESNGSALGPVTLSGIGALQEVPNGTVITLRLYGWGASAAGGTAAIGRLSGDDLVVAGTVEALAGDTPPAVGSPTSADIAETTATLGGTVTSDGGAPPITKRGIIWSTTEGFDPEVTGTEVSETGSFGTGAFTVNVTGLPDSSTIYFRAFAENSEGAGYSSEDSFDTLLPPPPGALVYYTFTDSSASPSAFDAEVTAGDFELSSGSVNFGTTAGGWDGSGVPYAQGTGGWTANNQADAKHFILVIEADEDRALTITNISFYARPTGAGPAALGLAIAGSDLAGTATDVAGNTTVAHSFAIDGFSNLAGPVAIKIQGWDNGSRSTSGGGDFRIDDVLVQGFVDDFIPTIEAPTVTTPTHTQIEDTSATLGGTITDTGGEDADEWGVYWSTSDGFTPPGQGTKASATGSQDVGAFQVNATGLPEATEIFYRAFASNSGGEDFSDQSSFVTRPPVGESYFIDFESETKSSYTAGDVTLNGIDWNLENALLGADAQDAKAGDRSMRVRHETALAGTAAMIQNKAAGVGYITFLYAHCGFSGDNNGITFVVEYSTNDGANWTQAGDPIDTAGVADLTHAYRAIFATGNVRVRFRTTAASSSGRRANIDNIELHDFVTSVAPTLSAPSFASVTHNSATLGATIDNDGGSDIIRRGTVWNETGAPITENEADEGGTSVAAFSHSRSSLPSGTLIHFRGYAENEENLIGFSPNGQFYTLSVEPSTHAGSFVAAPASSATVDLEWTTAAGADGYLILRRAGAAPTGAPADATGYSVSDAIGDGTVAAVIANGAATSTTVSGLSAGETYHFTIFPFSYNGSNAETYNYKTDGTVPSADATTFSAPPTTAASSITFSSVGATGMTIGWNNGNGANRIVVLHEGSAVNANPANGTSYSADNAYGDGAEIGTGNFVVFNGSGSSVAVTGLSPDTLYHVAVYEYNGSGSTTSYKTDAFPTANQATLGTSTIQLSGTSYSENFDGIDSVLPAGVRIHTGAGASTLGTQLPFSNLRIDWGNSAGAFKNFASTNDLTELSNATAQNNANNRALGIRQTGSFGDSGAAFVFVIENTLGFENIEFGIDLLMLSVQGRSTTWTIDYRVGNSGSFTSLGTYTDPGAFGGTRFTESLGMDAANQANPVYIRVVALTGSTGSGSRDSFGIDNMTLAYDEAAVSVPALSTPTHSAVGVTTATLGATLVNNGNDAISARGTVWGTSPNPTGNAVAEGGTGLGAFTHARTGLDAGTLIYYRGYAVNGQGTGYSPDGSFFTLSAEPTTHAGSFDAEPDSGTSIDLTWTTATGADGYLILQRENAAPTGTPTDATGYSVSDALGDGVVAAVVQNGAATDTTISGLTPDTTYHFTIIPFGYNSTDAETYNYKTDGTIPSASATTLVEAPSSPALNITFTAVQLSAMTINWFNGDGANRIVVVREGAAVNATPTDGTGYSANTAFGSGSQIGSGNYVVFNGSGNSVSITGLEEETAYYVAVFEYNGAGASADYKTDEFPTANQATLSSSTITLSGTSYAENFNGIDEKLPTGARVYTSATSSSLGTQTHFNSARSPWDQFAMAGEFKNFASTNALTSTASNEDQLASNERALGIRQSGSFGDSGAAFVFVIENTLGFENLEFGIDLLMLSVQGRSTTWTIDYRVGNTGSFTSLGTYTDPDSFGGTRFTQSLGSDANNQILPVYIRVAALSTSSGSGFRDSFGVDNLALTYQAASTTVPSLANPTATAIGSTTATLGATLTSDGGDAITERGTVWGTTPNPTGNDNDEGGTSLGAFSHPRTSLPAATFIYYRGYAINGIGTGYSPDGTFWTLSAEPSSHAGNFTASPISSSSIGLSWTAATGANGYLIVRRAGAAPTGTPADGTAYNAGQSIGDGVVAAVISGGGTTTATMTGLNDNTVYHFAIFAFGYDGSNPETYNYRTTAVVPTTSAQTFEAVTIVQWTFPGLGGGSGSAAADDGLPANVGNNITTVGGTSAIGFSQTGAAGGTDRAANATAWDGGLSSKWWQVTFSTVGHAQLTLSSKQRSSSTAPRHFAIQYSLDGISWAHLANVPNVGDNFTAGAVTDEPLPAVLENKSQVYLRWLMRSNVAGSGDVAVNGNSRIDDIIVKGIEADFDEADLEVSATALPATAYPWTDLNLTITVQNKDVAAVSNVLLTAQLPANAQFVAASHGGQHSGQGVSWEINNLAGNSSVQRVLAVQPTSLDDVVTELQLYASATPINPATWAFTSEVSVICNPASVPGIVPLNNPVGTEGQQLNFTVQAFASGCTPDGLTMTFGGAPAGSIVGAAQTSGQFLQRTVSWTPGTAGTYPMQVDVTDGVINTSVVVLIHIGEPGEPTQPGTGIPVSQVNWAPEITDVVLPNASDATVRWTSVEDVTYVLYYSDDLPGGSMTWHAYATVTADGNEEEMTLNSNVPRRYFQVAPLGQSPNEFQPWAVIRPLIPQGFSMQGPPLVTDRSFGEDGELGEILAAALSGGATSLASDKIRILNNGQWIELWLNSGNNRWYDSSTDQPTDFVLNAGQGYFVERTQGGQTRPIFTGQIGNVGERVNTISSGWNLISLSEGRRVTVQSAFSDANVSSPPVGSTLENSDQIVLSLPDGTWITFMRRSDGTWRNMTTGNSGGQFVLEPGWGYYYLRQNSGGTMHVTF